VVEFEGFLRELDGIPEEKCRRMKQRVKSTLKLLREIPGVETLDQLAARIEKDLSDWRSQNPGLLGTTEHWKREEAAATQILDAKIATSAMFLAREEKARRAHLGRYGTFIDRILGGPPWERAGAADCHVLTFNYDRLFEIAFSEAFPTLGTPKCPLYAGEALNSGFDASYGGWSIVKPTPGRFSFLKLHGSIGWWAKVKRPPVGGRRQYCPADPGACLAVEQIDGAIPDECGGLLGWEPLLAFPHERQGSRKYLKDRGESSDYIWAPYVDNVWEHAAGVVREATDIRVIGYSFNRIDSRYMVEELLEKAKCEKIVVQNKVDVRGNLESYRQFDGRLEFDPTPF